MIRPTRPLPLALAALLGLAPAALPGADFDPTPDHPDGGLTLELPMGGWRNSQGEPLEYLQQVEYPASDAHVDEDTSTANRIKGRAPRLPRPAAGAEDAAEEATEGDEAPPLTLIVNGIAMPQRVENGLFERAYSFSPGSNSVEVRDAERTAVARVQFYEAYQDRLQPRIRVFLSWDTDDTDLDLHVVTPDGEHCNYENRVLANGGALDMDVTTGHGPEIFATPNALPGTYLVYLNYYGGPDYYDSEDPGITVATVSIVTDENTPDERLRTYTVPMRHPGELLRVTAFSYP